MKSFLKDVQRESDAFRSDAIRIEQMQKELTTEFRTLKTDATTKVFLNERPKSPVRGGGLYTPDTARTAPIKKKFRTLSQEFKLSSPRANKHKNVLMTQSVETFHTSTMPTQNNKNKNQIDIESIPEASVPKMKTPPLHSIRMPNTLADLLAN